MIEATRAGITDLVKAFANRELGEDSADASSAKQVHRLLSEAHVIDFELPEDSRIRTLDELIEEMCLLQVHIHIILHN